MGLLLGAQTKCLNVGIYKKFYLNITLGIHKSDIFVIQIFRFNIILIFFPYTKRKDRKYPIYRWHGLEELFRIYTFIPVIPSSHTSPPFLFLFGLYQQASFLFWHFGGCKQCECLQENQKPGKIKRSLNSWLWFVFFSKRQCLRPIQSLATVSPLMLGLYSWQSAFLM